MNKGKCYLRSVRTISLLWGKGINNLFVFGYKHFIYVIIACVDPKS
jgi:hypothetical protein